MEKNTTDKNPFIYSDTNKRYHTYDYYLKKKFGVKCIKIPLDCGFTCPNIDGAKGYGGCTYCTAASAVRENLTIGEQYKNACEILYKKWISKNENFKIIPYFQTCTNTYAPLEKLKILYETALNLPGAAGLNIATRADALGDSTVEYLHELSKRTFLTVELGLQTIHDSTAEKINRLHTFNEFIRGFYKLRGKNINVCVHIINGLPGENKKMMIQTAEKLSELHPQGVKIHLLHILKNTVMADQYLNGGIRILTLDEYADITTDQIRRLPADIYIGRVTGDGAKSELIAPLWSLKKFTVMNEIDKKFAALNTYQGEPFDSHKIY